MPLKDKDVSGTVCGFYSKRAESSNKKPSVGTDCTDLRLTR